MATGVASSGCGFFVAETLGASGFGLALMLAGGAFCAVGGAMCISPPLAPIGAAVASVGLSFVAIGLGIAILSVGLNSVFFSTCSALGCSSVSVEASLDLDSPGL